MSLIRNTAWSAIAALVLTGGRFLITLLFARLLGVNEFGQFAFSQWLVEIGFLTLAFGLPGTANRFYAELKTTPMHLWGLERWFLTRSLIIVVVLAFTSSGLLIIFNRDIGVKLLILQAGWSACSASWSLLLARAQGLQQFQRVALSNAAFVVIELSGCIFYAKNGLALSEAMFLAMIGSLVAAIVTWIPLIPDENSQKSKGMSFYSKTVKAFSINIWLSSLVSALVWSRGELMVVRSELNALDLSVYSVALSLTGIASQGLMLLTGAIGPHLTQFYGEGKEEKAIALCCRYTDFLAFTSGILCAFLLIFTPEIIIYTFGESYLNAQTALKILGFGTIGLACAALNQLLQIKTNGKFSRNINGIGAILLFLFSFPMVWILGLEGAALSRAFVQITVSGVTIYFAYQSVSPLSVNWKIQVKLLILSFIITVLSCIAHSSIYIRICEFIVFSILVILLIRDQSGHLVFANITRKIQSILLQGMSKKGIR